jgi:glycosyltransferase involved in cell wall biosynthesis
MNSPRVSVIVPVFNREAVVGEAVASLARQTLEDMEIIVIDDGSSDASAEVAEGAAGGRQVRVILHPNNRGIPAARNTGLQAARGEYIAWLDSDDLARPERLERQASFLAGHPDIALVGAGAGRLDAYGRPKRRTRVPFLTHETLAPALLFRSPFQQSSIMGRAEVLKAFEYRAEFPVCEDLDMFIRISRQHRLANLKDVLIDRRLHQGQIGRVESAQVRGLKRMLLRGLLGRLGIEPSEWDLERHTTLGAPKNQPQSRQFIAWAESWMKTLERANDKAAYYDPRGLALVCARTWANACLVSMRRNQRLQVGASLVSSSLTLGFANIYGAEWVAAALPGLLGIG